MVTTSQERPAFEPDHEPDEALEVVLESEDSITTATMFARELCNLVRLRGYAGQKFVTAVRELARHILRHAGEGRVRLRVSSEGDRVLCVGEDRGPALGDLQDYLADRRRGRALASAARLSQSIELRREGERNIIELGFKF